MRKFRTALLAAASIAATLAFTGPGSAQSEQPPKPGGTLEIGTVYVTLSALSWDNADWNWKHNHDTGQVYEQLFAADLSKSKRLGGKHPFYADAWLPSDAIRGELAETWSWKQDPLRMEVKLRKGIMFPEKPGVMAAREFVADDVVNTFNRLDKSPKKITGYFDHLEKVEATDKHTVVFTFKNYNAEWDYRFGWGYYSGIIPKEVADAGAGNWKNVNGTGPFMLADFVQGNSNTYVKNPNYWDKDKINGIEMKLPLVDKVVFRTIKDEATNLTALRTGKLDILEYIRWSAVDELKKNAPQLQWSKWLNMNGQFLAMRVDTNRSTTSAFAAHSTWPSTSRRSSRTTMAAMPNCSPIRSTPIISAISSRWTRCLIRSRSSTPTTRRRRRSCWRKRACRTASPSRSRSAPARPTTWTCCRWLPPISNRSASS
jgi:peptide/nickel transport system substrate-binding protein